jgi:FkbM family methyltransferase
VTGSDSSNKRKKPFGKSDGWRRFKLALKRLIGREPRLKLDKNVKLKRFGDWHLVEDLVENGQVIYSLGVGEDIEFDLELIKAKDVLIFAFDPTPNSIAWLETMALPDQFQFYPWAAAEQNGSLYLYPRIRGDGSQSRVMYTILPEPEARDDGVEVAAKTVEQIMKDLNHEHIDVLKMDIEGAEYGVLNTLLDSDTRPGQLLIEFHHRFPDLNVSHTLHAINRLRQAEYSLVYISVTGREFTFIKNP